QRAARQPGGAAGQRASRGAAHARGPAVLRAATSTGRRGALARCSGGDRSRHRDRRADGGPRWADRRRGRPGERRPRKDQRQHPRFAIELDAEMTVDGAAVTGRTQDISKGGFCMSTQEPVAVPATGQVKLALVFSDTEFSEHLTLAATTVWCTPLKTGYQVGV